MIDKLCKRILGYPEILGRIIKGFIKEAEERKEGSGREFLFPTAK